MQVQCLLFGLFIQKVHRHTKQIPVDNTFRVFCNFISSSQNRCGKIQTLQPMSFNTLFFSSVNWLLWHSKLSKVASHQFLLSVLHILILMWAIHLYKSKNNLKMYSNILFKVTITCHFIVRRNHYSWAICSNRI